MSDDVLNEPGASEFVVVAVMIRLRVDGAAGPIEEDRPNPDLWELIKSDKQHFGDGTFKPPSPENKAANAAAVAAIVPEISMRLAPAISHYVSIGGVRLDSVGSLNTDGDVPNDTIGVFLVAEHACDVSELLQLGSQEDATYELAALRGGSLTITSAATLVAADVLWQDAKLLDGPSDDWCQLDGPAGVWGGETAPERLPLPGETRDHWLARIALSAKQVSRLLKRWEHSGRDYAVFPTLGSASERAGGGGAVRWLIPGLIPLDMFTLIVGPQRAGKSTLMLELAAVVSSEVAGDRYFLGIPVSERSGASMLVGEGAIRIFNDLEDIYAQQYGDDDGEMMIQMLDTTQHTWPAARELFRRASDTRLRIIDPARAVMEGNEDDAATVSRFCDDLTVMADQDGAAVIATHHLGKGLPNSFSKMLQAIRGSSVWMQRPRMILGMLPRGEDHVEIAILKHNFGPREKLFAPINVGRLFRKDAATMTLIEAERHRPDASSPQLKAASDTTLVFEALKAELAAGRVVRRTGASELFALKLTALAGMPRAAIRSDVGNLIGSRKVLDRLDGLTLASQGTPNE